MDFNSGLILQFGQDNSRIGPSTVVLPISYTTVTYHASFFYSENAPNDGWSPSCFNLSTTNRSNSSVVFGNRGTTCYHWFSIGY